MPNIIGQPNPNNIDLHSDVSVWQYPMTPELGDTNPAAQARAEYERGLYVDALASDDSESRAVETGQPLTPIREGGAPVNAYETVPAAGEIAGYSTNRGEAIDPAHAEAVLAATADVLSSYDTPEVPVTTAEHHAAAIAQAAAYGPRIEDIRTHALVVWGAEGEA